MPMVWHQAVRDHAHRRSDVGLAEHLFEDGIVLVLLKQGQAANPPVEHVIGDPAAVDSQASGHAATLPPGNAAATISKPDPLF